MGSPFASQTTSAPIPLPCDPPHTIVVRKLTALEIDGAQQTHRAGLLSGDGRSWAATFKRALERGATDPEVLQALADPLTGYDRYALVRAGLVSWSYPQSLTPVPAKAATPAKGKEPGAPATPAYDAIGDLDDEAVDVIAREVLRLTKPSLFLTADEREAARKNG